MIILGITGSIASGKSTVSRLIAKKKYPLFSADKIVSDLYKNVEFVRQLSKEFNLNNKEKVKNQIRLIIKNNKTNFKKLESLIHPLVRKKMKNFLKIKNKILVLEIPLLKEKKLNKFFNKIIFVEAKKKLRLKRYLKRNNDKKLFETLNKRQLSSNVKKKACDFIINNNYSLTILKKNVKKFMKIYE